MNSHRRIIIQVPENVLCAFGATDKPIRIQEGQGQAFRSGNIVLKPANDDEPTNWIANFYLSTHSDGFRLPKPILSKNGCFVFEGWQAWEFALGQHKKENWLQDIKLCVAFHQAIAEIQRPDWFDNQDLSNPWIVADKVAWDEMEFEHHPTIAPAVEQLRKCLRNFDQRSQLIHGDFGGNVLYSDTLTPAIIDFSPSWRPAEFAVGIVVSDAIVWGGADKSLLEVGNDIEHFYHNLARAELRRVIELDTLFQLYGWEMLEELGFHLPLIGAITERCS